MKQGWKSHPPLLLTKRKLATFTPLVRCTESSLRNRLLASLQKGGGGALPLYLILIMIWWWWWGMLLLLLLSLILIIIIIISIIIIIISIFLLLLLLLISLGRRSLPASLALLRRPPASLCGPRCTPPPDHTQFGKGQTGSALTGSLQITCFLTEGPFGYSR